MQSLTSVIAQLVRCWFSSYQSCFATMVLMAMVNIKMAATLTTLIS